MVAAGMRLETLNVGAVQNPCGWFLNTRGRFAMSIRMYKDSLAIRETLLDPDHINLVYGLSDLAIAMLSKRLVTSEMLASLVNDAEPKKDNAIRAESLARRALDICERIRGNDHPATADALLALGRVLLSQTRYPEVEAILRRALDITERVLGSDHLETARILRYLALSIANQRQSEETAILTRRSLVIVEGMLGMEHKDAAISQVAIAATLIQQGRLAEAEPLCRRALEILQEHSGENAPDTEGALIAYGSLLINSGRKKEGKAFLKRAAASRRVQEEAEAADLAEMEAWERSL